MSWFSKSATIEPEPETPPVNPAQERLEQVEVELPLLIAARDEIRKQVRELRARVRDPRVTVLPLGLFTSVNAMHMACPHAEIEKAQWRADVAVENMLSERADLLRKLGRIR